MIDPDHPYMKTFTLLKEQFQDEEAGSGRKSRVGLIEGVTGLSKELVPYWNVTMKGNATFDGTFG